MIETKTDKTPPASWVLASQYSPVWLFAGKKIALMVFCLLIPAGLSSEILLDERTLESSTHSESKVNLDLLQYSKVYRSPTSATEPEKTPRSNSVHELNNANYRALNPLDSQEPCFSFDFEDSCEDEEYSPGAALGKLLRHGIKAWWRNLPPTKLHRIEEATPEVVKTGNFNGSTQNNWDYSLKLSGDKVKLKLEREFE